MPSAAHSSDRHNSLHKLTDSEEVQLWFWTQDITTIQSTSVSWPTERDCSRWSSGQTNWHTAEYSCHWSRRKIHVPQTYNWTVQPLEVKTQLRVMRIWAIQTRHVYVRCYHRGCCCCYCCLSAKEFRDVPHIPDHWMKSTLLQLTVLMLNIQNVPGVYSSICDEVTYEVLYLVSIL